MKKAIAICFPLSLLAAYTYYYSDTLATVNAMYWYSNGSVSGGSSGLTATSMYGGSLISKVAIPDGSSLSEVKTTLTLTATGGTYVSYLNASTNALSAPGTAAAGTYYAVELQNPTISGGACSAALVLYKNVGGVVTVIQSNSSVTCFNGMTIRAVRATGSQILVYLSNTLILYAIDSSITSGQPGIGARGTPSGNSVANVALGPLDRIAPNPFNTPYTATDAFANRVDIQWPAVLDDVNGTGVAFYEVYRNGTLLANLPWNATTFSDTTVAPSTSYTYIIEALDFHFNLVYETLAIATPPINSIDPRRVGIRPTGAYWGSAGIESIDVLSGNMNFTIPLLKALGRQGSGVSFSLAYNSQNWREDAGGALWNMGKDVGYGYGWKLLAGSLTPAWSSYFTIDHYTFTDGSGAEYRLTIDTAGIWTSTESKYVTYDSNAGKLFFQDGSFWVLGSCSAGSEEDAGSCYPTLIEDTNGNQLLISYWAGVGTPWWYTSARISQIEDVRATSSSGILASSTYTFNYNTDPIPHLTSITNSIGTAEAYTLTYSASYTLGAPFSPYTGGGSFQLLTSVTTQGIGTTTSLYYVSNPNGSVSGELVEAVLPYGGWLDWNYDSVTYSTNRTYREVADRYLAKAGGSTYTTYAFSHEPTPGSNVRQYTIINDPGGVGQKYWAFSQSGANIGLVTQYQGNDLSTGPAVTKTLTNYTWTQDSTGNNYIGTTLTTLDPGQTYSSTKQTSQTVDLNGNVTQVLNYGYGTSGSGTPGALVRTYNYSYLNSSPYPSLHIVNRLTSATLTDSTGRVTLASMAYDGTIPTSLSPVPAQWDTSYYSITARGNPTTSTVPGTNTTNTYDITGNVASTVVNGVTSTVTTSSTTNFVAPSQVTVGSLQTSMTYSTSLGLSTQTDPNSVTAMSIGYDTVARPITSTSPLGAVTTNTYNSTASPPNIVTVVNVGGVTRWTETIMDGLGRTVQVLSGTGSSAGSGGLSQMETTYGSCGCSPLGKMVSQTLPHTYGSSAAATTTYTYDGIGRTLSKASVGTDTQGTSSYVYQGNQVTSTDPAGNWKTFTTDAFGNLLQVLEPNPAGGTFTTTYSYDSLNHLISVSMPRGTSTQTRTFNYGSPPGVLLLSATNPESGTTTYTYNGNNQVYTRTDAKGQVTLYSYDFAARLSEVQHYPTWPTEDLCQRQNLTYDTYGSGTNLHGRLALAQYMANCASGSGDSILEYYSYDAAGDPISKWFSVTRGGNTYTLQGTWTYNQEGRMTQVLYPPSANNPSGTAYNYVYDAMGRLYTMGSPSAGINPTSNLVSAVYYNAANQLTQLTASGTALNSEFRTYNTLGQLTELTANSGPATLDYKYNYPSTNNNGKVASRTDVLSGEQVTYSYDALKRLLTAGNGSGGTGGNPAPWTFAYTYDGFGNVLSQAGTGTALLESQAMVTYSYLTNRQTGDVADPNGNLGAGPLGNVYDVENRLTQPGSAGGAIYAYAPDNKRVWRNTAGVTDEFTFWSPTGKRLATYTLTHSGVVGPFTQTGSWVYFKSRLVEVGGAGGAITGTVFPDRALSIGTYYPYGQPDYSPANATFTGYIRDIETGLDYASQRYYQSVMGRFMTPDPYIASVGPSDPGSWNRYAYTRGDPVNRIDHHGTCDTDTFDDDNGDESDCYPESEGGGGGGANGPPTPECSITVYSRPVKFNKFPGRHTYIYYTDPELTQADNPGIIQGDPWHGLLTGFLTPPGGGPGAGTGHASDPTLDNNRQQGQTYTGVNACADIQVMLIMVNNYNQLGPKVKYGFNPNGATTWNSNSFTYTLLTDVGLLYFTNIQNTTTVNLFGYPISLPYPGWGMTVPSLYIVP